MKKLFIYLFILTNINLVAQSSFCDGWEKGYQKGLKSCLEISITPICPIPRPFGDSYSDGYGRGYSSAEEKCRETNQSSQYNEPSQYSDLPQFSGNYSSDNNNYSSGISDEFQGWKTDYEVNYDYFNNSSNKSNSYNQSISSEKINEENRIENQQQEILDLMFKIGQANIKNNSFSEQVIGLVKAKHRVNKKIYETRDTEMRDKYFWNLFQIQKALSDFNEIIRLIPEYRKGAKTILPTINQSSLDEDELYTYYFSKSVLNGLYSDKNLEFKWVTSSLSKGEDIGKIEITVLPNPSISTKFSQEKSQEALSFFRKLNMFFKSAESNQNSIDSSPNKYRGEIQNSIKQKIKIKSFISPFFSNLIPQTINKYIIQLYNFDEIRLSNKTFFADNFLIGDLKSTYLFIEMGVVKGRSALLKVESGNSSGETYVDGDLIFILDNERTIICKDRDSTERLNGDIVSYYYLTNAEINLLRKNRISYVEFKTSNGYNLSRYVIINDDIEKSDIERLFYH